MLYRAIIGFVPMIVILLFATGAIPLSSVVPTSSGSIGGDTLSSIKEEAEAEGVTPGHKLSEKLAVGVGEATGVTDMGMSPGDAVRLHSEMSRELRRYETEERKRAQERRAGIKHEEWEARGTGWGQ